jgi:phosphoglycolate phosphatase
LQLMYLQMNKRYEVVIFDWDGTLIDSQAQIVICMQAAFRHHQLTPPEPAAIRHIVGLSLDKAISLLAPEIDFDMVDLLIDAYRSNAYASSRHSSDLFLGVKTCLTYLLQQNQRN